MYIYERGDPTIQFPIFCKLRMYLPHVWGQMGRYFIVLASIDRFAVTNTNVSLRALSRPYIARWLLKFGIDLLWMSDLLQRETITDSRQTDQK